MITKRIALIPAYEPDEKLIQLLKELVPTGMDIIVVNDGSDASYNPIFEEAAKYAKVLNHIQNYGKGRALKTGMMDILAAYKESYVVITLDADGQHTVKDAQKIADFASEHPHALVLGSRKFQGDIPLRSKFGNTLTKSVYYLSTGTKIQDTQTGLRAFTHRNIHPLLDIEGERYEYEMNVLLEATELGIEIKELPIQTIYLDNNTSSHFDSMKDSFRIYKEIIKFSASSIISFALDYMLFSLLFLITGGLFLSNIMARCLSSIFNFLVNKKYVFRSQENIKTAAIKYFSLVALLLLGNSVCISLLHQGLGVNVFLSKLLTEVILFFISLSVQKFFIFTKKEKDLCEPEIPPIGAGVHR